MATPAQVLANRENAKLSTGPRTEEGKAASSANARTHGFNAADPVLPTEDRNQFNALLDSFKSEWAPETEHQNFLVAQITGAKWKLDRLQRIESDMFAALDDPAKAYTDKETAAGFTRLERYRAALERTYHRCVRELRLSAKLQKEAKSAQEDEKKEKEMWAALAERRRARGSMTNFGPFDNFVDTRVSGKPSNNNS